MTFIHILIVAIWKSRRLSGHTGGEICHFKLLNYLYLTIMWWERTQFSNSTCWMGLVGSPPKDIGDWCSHTRGSEFISNSTSSHWRWILNHSCENTSLQCLSVENLQFSPTRDWEQHSRESVLLLLGWEHECSHIRVWEHLGEFWLVNQLYRPIRNVF